ncbi:MAG: glycosyltransferase [Promethearchaeota archaeon]
MNILYIVNYFPPSTGAAALNSLKIAEYLTNYNHNIQILAPGDMGEHFKLKGFKEFDDSKKIKVLYSSRLIRHPLNLIFSHLENFIRFFVKIKKSFKPDVILTQYHAFHYASVVGAQLSKILEIPHVVRSHDIFIDLESHSIPYRLYNLATYPQIYRSIKKSNIFYVTTSEMIRYFQKFKKLKGVNFKVHHNGIDIKQFYPSNKQEVLKEKYGCNTIISFIGLMTEDIGVHNFIKILPEFLRNHTDTHIILIGGGLYKEYILNLIKKLDLNKQIHFLGLKPHKEIPFYINNSDIGLGRITHKKMWRYMIPVKCLEYMACKKTFITSPISHDIIEKNDVGILLKRDFTDKDLINSLNILIEDKLYRNKLGENGFKKIHREFRWEKLMSEFNRDIKDLK